MVDIPATPSRPASPSPSPTLVADVARVLREQAPRTTPAERFEADAWAAMLDVAGARLLTRESLVAHVTASAVVLSTDGTRTCLVLHGRFGIWVQPGGHVEPEDTSIAAAAAREAREETGLVGTLLPDVMLSRHLAPCRPGVDYHLDVRYVLVTDPVEPEVSSESRDVRWWPVDALPDGLGADVAQSVAFATAAHRRAHA